MTTFGEEKGKKLYEGTVKERPVTQSKAVGIHE